MCPTIGRLCEPLSPGCRMCRSAAKRVALIHRQHTCLRCCPTVKTSFNLLGGGAMKGEESTRRGSGRLGCHTHVTCSLAAPHATEVCI